MFDFSFLVLMIIYYTNGLQQLNMLNNILIQLISLTLSLALILIYVKEIVEILEKAINPENFMHNSMFDEGEEFYVREQISLNFTRWYTKNVCVLFFYICLRKRKLRKALIKLLIVIWMKILCAIPYCNTFENEFQTIDD